MGDEQASQVNGSLIQAQGILSHSQSEQMGPELLKIIVSQLMLPQ